MLTDAYRARIEAAMEQGARRARQQDGRTTRAWTLGAGNHERALRDDLEAPASLFDTGDTA